MLENLPDSLILKILDYCHPNDVAHVEQLSTTLRDVCRDQVLWRILFHRYFRIPGFYADPFIHRTWKSEFIRLHDEVPVVETEVIREHGNQVLHVAFSHDGKRFVTTGKDAYIHVWKAIYPTQIEFSYEMTKFSWKYTQYAEFNEADTRLLVSGVQFGTHSTSGEIAIFGLTNDTFELRCRTSNKPYDVFGTWYSDNYFFSGDLHWLDYLVSKSDIWLNKASQETDSEHKAIMNHLYKFYNPKASSIRSILVANCCDTKDEISADECPENDGDGWRSRNLSPNASQGWGKPRRGNPPSKIVSRRDPTRDGLAVGGGEIDVDSVASTGNTIASIEYSDGFHRMLAERRNEGKRTFVPLVNESTPSTSKSLRTTGTSSENSSPPDLSPGDSLEDRQESLSSATSSDKGLDTPDDEDGVMDPREKIFIFTCGSQTYTPHQIGFKRMQPFPFKGRLELGLSLAERILEKKRRDAEEALQIDYSDQKAVAHLFDTADAVIDLRGHIIGMTLSPDHRYLYVNSRPWPINAVISDPLFPPPIAQEIDIHVIDLVSLKQVGRMHRAHRAYTPNDECFFIFLNACNEYLASGAEDKAGYIWERHYGIPLVRLPHLDVVNSVAFNPKNPEMIVTVSDDHTAKIWRSKKLCRELGINYTDLPQGTQLF